jgi:hypothetical protein
MRIAITIAAAISFGAFGAPALAGNDVGVIVTGEGSLQPQLAAQIENWLTQHGRILVPTPLPPDAIPAINDCFVLEDEGCARRIVEQRAKSTGIIYAHLEATNNESNGTRDVTLTAYWFDRGHDAVAERKLCERCTDQSLRTAADEVMKKLLGGGAIGHVKLTSNPPGARISIDGMAIGVTPLDWDLPVGKHTIQMDLEKRGLAPVTRDIVVASERTDVVALELAPREQSGPSRVLPIAVMSAGGALLITGGVLIAIDQDPLPKEPARIYDTAAQGVALAIGGAVVVGVGAYLWFRSSKASSAPVASVTGNTAYIGWLGRF